MSTNSMYFELCREMSFMRLKIAFMLQPNLLFLLARCWCNQVFTEKNSLLEHWSTQICYRYLEFENLEWPPLSLFLASSRPLQLTQFLWLVANLGHREEAEEEAMMRPRPYDPSQPIRVCPHKDEDIQMRLKLCELLWANQSLSSPLLANLGYLKMCHFLSMETTSEFK